VDGAAWLEVVWFNQPWIVDRLAAGEEAVLFGSVRHSTVGELQLVNPEVIGGGEQSDTWSWQPRYAPLGPLNERRIRALMPHALAVVRGQEDPLPPSVGAELGVSTRIELLEAVHRPRPGDWPLELQYTEATRAARRRLALEELIATTATGVLDRRLRSSLNASVCRVSDDVREMARAALPFRLTGAQRQATREIVSDLGRRRPMARLLHGDVGSGKTVVAALAALVALANELQVAVMAPTELLAEQHHRSFERLLEATGRRPRLLTGSVSTKEREEILDGLERGTTGLVVGTHALIQETVTYRRLGLVIVDEQHRFGVTHRQALVDKSHAPHLLVMSATPIPRTLALTVYGGLDVSRIDELPPGRSPVRTVVRSQKAWPRLEAFLRREIAEGGRVYVVFPLIESSQSSERMTAVALQDRVEAVRESLPGASVGIVHGKLGRDERDQVTQAFRDGRLQVLLATTVIEVGVDVPEATVMVIESAERFGLSQLHQLRGRVGRGSRRSWCVLVTGPEVTAAARQRLDVLCRTNDGFEIAEEDLRLRGPGELAGLRQSGLAGLRFADLARDHELVEIASRISNRLADSGQLELVLPRLVGARAVNGPVPVG
jgi:ATP-dependent DNA helicase RecG